MKENINYIEKNNKFNKYKIYKNDILISLTGNVGNISIYKEDKYSYQNQRVGKICNFKNDSDKMYIFYCFLLGIFDKTLHYRSKGSIQDNISPDTLLNNILVPYPEKNVNNILNGLQKFENLNEIYEKNIKETQEEVTNKFLEYFKNY